MFARVVWVLTAIVWVLTAVVGVLITVVRVLADAVSMSDRRHPYRFGIALRGCWLATMVLVCAPVQAQSASPASSSPSAMSQSAMPQSSTAPAEADEPQPHAVRIRTKLIDRHGQVLNVIGPEGVGALPVVGERVTLVIDLLTPTWFTQSPRFEHLSMADAIAVTKSNFVNNISERIDGITYAGLRREFAIFPKRSGQFVIPAVGVATKTVADNRQPTAVRLRSKPMLLLVDELPEVAVESSAASASLVAESVSMEQRFTSSLESLQVGDVVQREIVVRAQSTLGMLIPLLTWPAVSGVKQQSLASTVNDDNARGAFTGLRQETRLYTLLRAGEVQLPAISLPWWDGRAWQWAQVPATTVTVAAAHERGDEAAVNAGAATGRFSGWANSGWGLLALLLSLLLALGLVWLRRRRLPAREQTATDLESPLLRWWRRQRQSEHVYYRRLRRAIHSGHSGRIVSCYYAWQQRLPLAAAAQHTPPGFEPLWAEAYGRATAQKPLTAQQQAALLSSVAVMHDTYVRSSPRRDGVKYLHTAPSGLAAVRSSDAESLSVLKELATLNPR